MTTLFDFDGHQITTVMNNGNVWFKAREVATALGYARPKDAVHDHVESDCKTKGQDLAIESQPCLSMNLGFTRWRSRVK